MTTEKVHKRKSRRDASAQEEERRVKEPLCMFNGIICEGAVTSSPREGRAFGETFTTSDVLCEYHRVHPMRPSKPKPQPIPVEQLGLPL